MERKLRKGPFKGQRLSEIDIAHLLAYVNSEAAKDADNQDHVFQAQDEIQRRMKTKL